MVGWVYVALVASGGRWALRSSKNEGLGLGCGLQGKKVLFFLERYQVVDENCCFLFERTIVCDLCFPGGSDGKEFSCNAGDLGSIPGLGRFPREWNSYPLQYSGLENSMDYSPWGQKELDTTERLSLSLFFWNFLQPSAKVGEVTRGSSHPWDFSGRKISWRCLWNISCAA